MAGNSAGEASQTSSFQTARLGTGSHDRPGAVVCVMELASMIAGERFSDRPVSVCPVIGAILRAYNDGLDDQRRADLYRYAAEAVGTRGDFLLQLRRAKVAISWARTRYRTRRRLARGSRSRSVPAPDWGPDQIAAYVIGALGRRRRGGGWSATDHTEILAVIDELIELGYEPATLAGDLVEQFAEPVEYRCRGAELVV